MQDHHMMINQIKEHSEEINQKVKQEADQKVLELEGTLAEVREALNQMSAICQSQKEYISHLERELEESKKVCYIKKF